MSTPPSDRSDLDNPAARAASDPLEKGLAARGRYFDYLLASAGCLFWAATVTERDGDLDWEIRMVDEAAAQRFLPLNLAPGQSYSEAWYWSKSPEDHVRMDEVSERAVR